MSFIDGKESLTHSTLEDGEDLFVQDQWKRKYHFKISSFLVPTGVTFNTLSDEIWNIITFSGEVIGEDTREEINSIDRKYGFQVLAEGLCPFYTDTPLPNIDSIQYPTDKRTCQWASLQLKQSRK